MSPFLRTTSLASAALFLASGALAANLDANIEFDNTYQNNDRGLTQGGRVELNVAGKVSNSYFVAGRASFLAKKDGSVATDDMWVQFGSDRADLKLGRFEAFNLFPLGRDTLVDNVATVYQANTLRGRFGNNTVGNGIFHAAGTFKAGNGLAVELGVVETRDGATVKGLRPVISYTTGPFSAAVGIEAIQYAEVAGSRPSETGIGITAKYNFGSFALNGNFASVKDVAGLKQTSYGLVLSENAFGGGLLHSNNDTGGGVDGKVTTAYVTYSMPLLDIQGATITPALSYSTGSGAYSGLNDSTGLRVRINYTF